MNRGKTKVHCLYPGRFSSSFVAHDLWPGDSVVWLDDGTESVVLPTMWQSGHNWAELLFNKVQLPLAVPYELDCSCKKVQE